MPDTGIPRLFSSAFNSETFISSRFVIVLGGFEFALGDGAVVDTGGVIFSCGVVTDVVDVTVVTVDEDEEEEEEALNVDLLPLVLLDEAGKFGITSCCCCNNCSCKNNCCCMSNKL